MKSTKVISLIVFIGIIGCSGSSPQPTPTANQDAGTTITIDSGEVDSGTTQDVIQVDTATDTANTQDVNTTTCPPTYTLCGTSYCVAPGSTCCASVGHPEISCPNGGTCNSNGVCTGSCVVNNNFTCTGASGYTAYSCTGPMTPTEQNNSLYCELSTPGIGSTLYCCVQQCTTPKGTYQYVLTTTSGNCGNIANSSFVFDGSNNLLIVAENAELCSGTSQYLIQDGSNVSPDVCSGSVSSTCTGYTSTFDLLSDYSVVSISSNQTGTQLNGTVSLTQTDKTTSQTVCSGTYSFVATRTGP